MGNQIVYLSEEEKQRRRALIEEFIQFRNDTGSHRVYVRFADYKGVEHSYLMKCWVWHYDLKKRAARKERSSTLGIAKITKAASVNESVKICFGSFSIEVTSVSNKEALAVALQALEATRVL